MYVKHGIYLFIFSRVSAHSISEYIFGSNNKGKRRGWVVPVNGNHESIFIFRGNTGGLADLTAVSEPVHAILFSAAPVRFTDLANRGGQCSHGWLRVSVKWAGMNGDEYFQRQNYLYSVAALCDGSEMSSGCFFFREEARSERKLLYLKQFSASYCSSSTRPDNHTGAELASLGS